MKSLLSIIAVLCFVGSTANARESELKRTERLKCTGGYTFEVFFGNLHANDYFRIVLQNGLKIEGVTRVRYDLDSNPYTFVFEIAENYAGLGNLIFYEVELYDGSCGLLKGIIQ